MQVSVTVTPANAASTAAQRDLARERAGTAAPDPVAAARVALRARVVALTRAAAATGPETNEVECGKVSRLHCVLDSDFKAKRLLTSAGKNFEGQWCGCSQGLPSLPPCRYRARPRGGEDGDLAVPVATS